MLALSLMQLLMTGEILVEEKNTPTKTKLCKLIN